MPRASAVVLAFVSVLTAQVAAQAQTAAPPGYASAKTADLYAGVEYAKLTNSRGPVVAHVAHILPGAGVELRVVNAGDRISSNPGELETTSSMCERVRCIVGINGDFHKIGVPAGGVVVDGRLLHSPDPDRSQLTVLKNGSLVAGTFSWAGAVKSSAGNDQPVNTVNAAPPANGLAVFTPEFGPSTEDSARVELVVKASKVGALNQSTSLQLLSLRTGAGPIPADGAVLSGDGSAGQALRDLWNRRQAGGPTPRLLISSPLDADMSLGVEPVVLKDGQRATPWRDPNVINPMQPHTLVGWNKAGDIYLVAVDGRQAASEGVNMAQAADFLRSLGATDAVSLDGGGGTVFVAGGAVWNRPSDNDPARPANYTERGATNALVVVPKPVAPPPTVKPTTRPAPQELPIGPMMARPDETTDPSAPSAEEVGDEPADPFFSQPLDMGGAPIDPLAAHISKLAPDAAPADPAPSGAGLLAGPTAGPDASTTTTPDTAATTTTADSGRVPGEPVALSDGEPGHAELAGPVKRPGPGKSGPPMTLLLLAGAVGGTGLLTATRRRSRSSDPELDVAAIVIPMPAAEELPPDEVAPDCTDDEVSIDAFAVILGGEGARQWHDTPELARLVDLRSFGLHELVPPADASRDNQRVGSRRRNSGGRGI